MSQLILRLIEPLLRLIAPPRGRHRTAPVQRYPSAIAHRRVLVCRTAVDFPPGYFPALRNTSGTLVRSRAQISYERLERVNRRLQQQRRRDLWFASYGIDAGPRVIQIHGMSVVR